MLSFLWSTKPFLFLGVCLIDTLLPLAIITFGMRHSSIPIKAIAGTDVKFLHSYGPFQLTSTWSFSILYFLHEKQEKMTCVYQMKLETIYSNTNWNIRTYITLISNQKVMVRLSSDPLGSIWLQWQIDCTLYQHFVVKLKENLCNST